VAIDLRLEDAPLGVEEVKAKLAAFESLKGIDLDKASQALASIRGLTLGLTVTDRRNGAIRVDFNEDISVIRDVAKPLLLEALGNQGMMINEFRDWNVQVTEKQVRLSGTLEDCGTRSPVELPGHAPFAATGRGQAGRKADAGVTGAARQPAVLQLDWVVAERPAQRQAESDDHGADQRLFPQLRPAD